MNIANVCFIGVLVKINDIKYHVTLEFIGNKKVAEKRNILNNIPLNMITDIKITHYGQYAPNNNLENVAYKVELPNYIKHLFKHQIPHITIAKYNGGKASNSYKCFTNEGMYQQLDKPVIIKGVIKCFNYNGEPIEVIDELV